MPDRIVVPAADFVRNIGHWQNQALEQPIAITYHGRERLILVSAKRFDEVREEGPNAEHPSTDATAPELQWLLDSMSDGYVLQTRDLEIVRANSVAATMFSVSPKEMIGRKLADFLPAAGAAVLSQRAEMVLRSGRLDSFEGEGAAFGEHFLSFQIAPMGDRIVTLIANQTERKIVEEQKQVGDAVLEALREMPGIAGVRVTPFGRICQSGRQFHAYTGFSASELHDVRLIDLIAQPYKRGFADSLERAISEKRTEMLDVTFLLKNGVLAVTRTSIAPVGQGSAAVVLVAFTDLQ
jgi:PAS domain-containing protein